MADDPASEPEAPEAPENTPRQASPSRSWVRVHRTLLVSVACVGLCGVIAADIYVMAKIGGRRPAQAPTATSVAPSPPDPPSAAARDASNQDTGRGPEAAPDEALDYQSDDGEPRGGADRSPPRRFATVQQAAQSSCTTASVDGLSRQIIAQARCIRPNAFVPLPSRPNLVIAPQVFPYLELEARDQLLKALDARPQLKMTINSALRTVAQQYLVRRWSLTKRCGVPLATPPGESNHELGLALDIAEAGSWRPLLEAQRFKWLGASDRVHFDFKGTRASPGTGTDVLAFQKLWNQNHPTDKISEDGRYSPGVEQRLKQAPADGFALGPSCEKGRAPKAK